MAQRTGNNSSPRSNSPGDFTDNHDRANSPVEDRRSDAHSANTSVHSTSRPTLGASSTTSNAGNPSSVTSTRVVPRQADTATGPAEQAKSIAGYSRPAYSSSKPSSRRELALCESAHRISQAMGSKEPLAELQKIFSGLDAVRLELPDLRGSFGIGPLSAYGLFCKEGWLEKLEVRYVDLTIEPRARQTGLSFEEHRIFLCKVIGTCNMLEKNGNAGVTLAIEVPLPQLPSDSPMRSHAIETMQIGLKNLFRALQADTVIVHLGLSRIRSEWFLQDVLSDFFASLATNGKLEALDLSHANLNNDDACALARALAENRSIKLINMTGCRTAEDGAEALANVLATRNGLQVIT